MYSTMILICWLGMSSAFRVSGEQKNLTEEEIETPYFTSLLEMANTECNKVMNHTSWFVVHGNVEGTKQLDSVLYQISFEQVETDCKREGMRYPKPSATSEACAETLNGEQHICMVEISHEHLTNNTEIVVISTRPKKEEEDTDEPQHDALNKPQKDDMNNTVVDDKDETEGHTMKKVPEKHANGTSEDPDMDKSGSKEVKKE